jgi:RecA/RadA recombinase
MIVGKKNGYGEDNMVKAFDVSKFRKNITKSIPGMSIGFRDPDTWISTGNYTLNKLISGDFNKGIPLGKVTVFAGESGSGKSFLASGNIVRNAQEQGIFVVLIDTENALDESWLKALGVDTSEDKLLKLNMAMIDDVAKVINDFVKDYKLNYSEIPEDQRPKILFVIDSLGMLMTPTDLEQFSKGELKGDMGRKPKALKALVTNCVNMFGEYNIGLVATNHVYASQNLYDPDPIVSGGSGFVFASSILISINKLKLKTDEDGNKSSDVLGIRAVCKVMKTRYSKPFEKVEIEIPYSTGMNPYSGMFDFFQKSGLLKKSGHRWEYVSEITGEVIKLYEKEWNKNTDGCLDLLMNEYDTVIKNRIVPETIIIEDEYNQNNNE